MPQANWESFVYYLHITMTKFWMNIRYFFCSKIAQGRDNIFYGTECKDFQREREKDIFAAGAK